MSSAEDERPAPGSSDRTFGIVFGIFFSLVGIAPLRHHEPVRVWALAVAGAFLLVAAAYPRVLGPANRWWTRFGHLLHRLTSPVALTIIYLVGIVPVGLFHRLAGKDPLRLKWSKDQSSYWIPREPASRPDARMRNQF